MSIESRDLKETRVVPSSQQIKEQSDRATLIFIFFLIRLQSLS